jgi:serine/threonine-protein kinase
VGWVAGGVGVVGVGLGSFFGLRAISDKNDGNAHCSGKFCDSQGLSDENTAHTYATLSTVSMIVGVVGLAAGAYFIVSGSSPQSAQLRVGPMVLARGSGGAAEVTW